MKYEHTQRGYIIYAILTGVALLVGIGFYKTTPAALIATSIVLTGCFILFAKLTVTVDRKQISWKFGFKFDSFKIDLAQVKHCEVVKTPWYYGWGLRLVPGGWLYNISGNRAVKIIKQDDSMIMIGSDEPEKLLKAIERNKAKI